MEQQPDTTERAAPRKRRSITNTTEDADSRKHSRRRTKTGCLTCRKRRIKCGEEHPVCSNCTKSKRECEGYNPRVVFRRGAAYPGIPGVFTCPGAAFDQDIHISSQTNTFAPPTALPYLQPKPNTHNAHGYEQYHAVSQAIPPDIRHYPIDTSGIREGWGPPSSTAHGSRYSTLAWTPVWVFKEPPMGPQVSQAESNLVLQSASPFHGGQVFPPPGNDQHYHALADPIDDFPTHNRGGPATGHWAPLTESHVQHLASRNIPSDEIVHVQPRDGRHFPLSIERPPSFGLPGPTQFLELAAVDTVDNDYYDCFTDEEAEDPQEESGPILSPSSPKELGAMAALYRRTTDELGLRSHDAFVAPGMMDHYRPQQTANPLRNEATARVFNHFISSTGPMLSVFERRIKSAYAIFQEREIPPCQQSLWSYTLPMMALYDQALLHAMLALSSLHVAKLQGAATTPAFKHYAYSLKKVRRAVAAQEKRHLVTTLAATLLIGFYEVMTAAHLSWSTLLVGAKQLIVEVNFIDLTKRLRAWKIRRAMERQHMQAGYTQAYGLADAPSLPEDSCLSRFEDIDLDLLRTFIGTKLPYDAFADSESPQETFTLTQLSECEVLQDLYWWYCRQDVIHALISGNHLLMDFELWSHCPPRAPIGVENAVYGSFDHLLILLARAARFIARDRTRKLKGSRYPSVPFYGHAPASDAHNRMPTAFGPPQPTHTVPAGPQANYDAETASAFTEWHFLRELFTVFAQRLSPAFVQLGPSEYQTFETPFGPGLIYRTHDTALLWMMYYMGLILLHRGHPSMPPAATAAIGAAARDTAPYATIIGRIGAGITSMVTSSPLNASIGAAFTGSIVPLFTAGVQYQDAYQRHWVVSRLREIEARSGWASAGLSARGCEKAWTQAAEMGMGPVYEPVCEDVSSEDVRISGKKKEGEASSAVNDRGYVPFSSKARLHFGFGMLGTTEELERMSLED